MYLYLLRRLYTKPVFLKTKTTFRASKSVVVKVIVRYNFRGCKELFLMINLVDLRQIRVALCTYLTCGDICGFAQIASHLLIVKSSVHTNDVRNVIRQIYLSQIRILYSSTCIYDKPVSISYYTITEFTKTPNSSSYIIFIFGIRNVVHVYNMMSFAALKSYNL